MVYVDLNSIMHSNAKYLAEWNERLGNRNPADYYRNAADKLLDAIGAVRIQNFATRYVIINCFPRLIKLPVDYD